MAIKKRQQEFILLILIIGVFFIALYYSSLQETCGDIECFKDKMKACKRAVYINEEPQASWGYEILGRNNNVCEIQIKLLNAKEGELGLRNKEGKTMVCSYDFGIFAYPEKNLDVCHGELKEGVQSIIIDKLYNYIIGNLGEIGQQLNNLNNTSGDNNTNINANSQ